MINQQHLKVVLGADKYDELLNTAKATSMLGRPLVDMSDQELMVALVLNQDRFRKAISSARQQGYYAATAVERGLRGEPHSRY